MSEIVKNANVFKQITAIIILLGSFNSVDAGESDSITFSWQWSAGNSGYVSGSGGDITFDLYMRTEDDTGYDFEYPTITGIDDCSLDGEQYNCQATLEHPFEPGVRYFFSVAAFLVDDQQTVSTLSNEIEFRVDAADERNDNSSSLTNPNASAVVDGQDSSNASSSSTAGAVSAGGCFIEIGFTK